MPTVIGVRFKLAGKIYYFDPSGFTINQGDHVIVETARGLEYAQVVVPDKEVPQEELISPLKPIVRIATAEDHKNRQHFAAKEKEAFDICLKKIHQHKLPMKLIDVEYTFDGSKIIFSFTADGRIDFRDLVKDLATMFRTRIELRQIGVRDEAKLIGGIGICGRALCCHSYLGDFAPVSIKMAKEQNLSLNPTKISGICGRLLCCLKYENDVYVANRKEEKANAARLKQLELERDPDDDTTEIIVERLTPRDTSAAKPRRDDRKSGTAREPRPPRDGHESKGGKAKTSSKPAKGAAPKAASKPPANHEHSGDKKAKSPSRRPRRRRAPKRSQTEES